MYKFIIYPLLILVILFANLDQLSNHASLLHYYKYKYAINRATHAAAMQMDSRALAEGYIVINEEEALAVALEILNKNVAEHSYSLKYFEVVQLSSFSTIPYYYSNKQWDIELILYRPAVVMVIETEYAHIISSKQPYSWTIFGTSEVVTSLF